MEEEVDYNKQLKEIEEKIEDAKENLGDSEVRDATYEKARILENMGRRDDAIKVYNETFKLTVGLSSKMDVVLNLIRIYVKDKNLEQIKLHIDKANKIFEEGGDWERKNRLKVYEGLYYLMIRNFKKTTDLFLQTISTFNSSEIISYNQFVYYTVLTSLISLPRTTIKEKIYHSPEVLAAIKETPGLQLFLESYYKCDYKQFFTSFVTILAGLPNDPYLAPHRKFFTREMRIVIYSQFLESYKTVTLEAMAQQFGVSIAFIDRELSELISARRINCKIDKVTGIVESERIDERNRHYKLTLRQGDSLLNKIQKLSRFVDI